MTNKTRPLFITLTWLAMVIIPLPLVLLLNHGVIDTPEHLAAYDCGAFAYVWWLLIVLLSTRQRWLTQRIGMPALYGIHGGLGMMALVAATIHRFTSFSMFPTIKVTGNIAWYLEIVLLAYAVFFLSGWLVDRFRNARRLKAWLEHHLLNHQVTMWIHRLNFVVIGLIWTHVNLIPRLRNVPGLIVTFDAYTIVALLVYCWWKLRSRPQGTVISNQALGKTTRELNIALHDSSNYRAGDFYFLSFQGVKGVSSEPHPFSVASVPGQTPTMVKFIIQQCGDFTRQIDSIQQGTHVLLEGPYGMFDHEVRNSIGPVILYGLGTGIAPLLSLAGQYASKKEIQLFWSGSEVNSAGYQDTLVRLEKLGVRIITQRHRFTQEQLSNLISARQVETGQVIIVGSASKVLYVHRSLRRRGFASSQLHDERITL